MDKDLVLIAMLKGSIPFLADICRAINMPISYDLIGIGAYGTQTGETGMVRITRDVELNVTGRHVLVIEEIVRSGLTTNYMIEHLERLKPASIALCSLLISPEELLITLPLRYVGFEIGYERVIGYGMDYRENGRNLPFIAKLDKKRFR